MTAHAARGAVPVRVAVVEAKGAPVAGSMASMAIWPWAFAAVPKRSMEMRLRQVPPASRSLSVRAGSLISREVEASGARAMAAPPGTCQGREVLPSAMKSETGRGAARAWLPIKQASDKRNMTRR